MGKGLTLPSPVIIHQCRYSVDAVCGQLVTTIPTRRLPRKLVLGEVTHAEIEQLEKSAEEDQLDEAGQRGQYLWIRGLTRLQHQVNWNALPVSSVPSKLHGSCAAQRPKQLCQGSHAFLKVLVFFLKFKALKVLENRAGVWKCLNFIPQVLWKSLNLVSQTVQNPKQLTLHNTFKWLECCDARLCRPVNQTNYDIKYLIKL